VALLPLTDERAGELLAQVPEDKQRECWWLVLRDHTLVAGDHGGGVKLLGAMRLTRWGGRGVQWLRLSPLIDALDHVLARHRQHLGRFVPEGAAPSRYP
jgi:hypothetical protein